LKTWSQSACGAIRIGRIAFGRIRPVVPYVPWLPHFRGLTA
jgi:hypothetical protein